MASTQTPAQKPSEQEQAPKKDQKATPTLEEDDEFEDFPVEGTYPLTFCCNLIELRSRAFLQRWQGVFRRMRMSTSPRGPPRGALRLAASSENQEPGPTQILERSLSQVDANDVMADWTQDEAEVPGNTTHLWEESWDDDDTSEDFSAQLKYAYPYYTTTITPFHISTTIISVDERTYDGSVYNIRSSSDASFGRAISSAFSL